MKELEWKKGWPPFKGWWNMSPDRDPYEWRWVDPKSKFISVFVFSDENQIAAGSFASGRSNYSINDLEYTDHWPKGARVPRIDPRKVKP